MAEDKSLAPTGYISVGDTKKTPAPEKPDKPIKGDVSIEDDTYTSLDAKTYKPELFDDLIEPDEDKIMPKSRKASLRSMGKRITHDMSKTKTESAEGEDKVDEFDVALDDIMSASLGDDPFGDKIKQDLVKSKNAADFMKNFKKTAMDNLKQRVKQDDSLKKAQDRILGNEASQAKAEFSAEMAKQEEAQKKVRAAYKEASRVSQQVRQSLIQGINPYNFWESRTNFAKVIGALSLGAGAFGAAGTGGTNSALQIIQDAIKNDISIQEKNLLFKQDASQEARQDLATRIGMERDTRNRRIDMMSRRLGMVKYIADQKRNSLGQQHAGRKQVMDLIAGLNQLELKAQLDKLNPDLDRQLKEATLMEKQQKIAQAEQQNTLTSAHVPLPGLQGLGNFTFGRDPEAKRKVVEGLSSLNVRFSSSNEAIKAVNALENFMSENKITSLFQIPTKEFRKSLDRLKSELKTQIKATHDAIQADPRMSKEDMALAQEVMGADELDGLFKFSRARLTNGLNKIKQTMVLLANKSAREFYSNLAARSDQSTAVTKASRNLFNQKPHVELGQHNVRVFNIVKGSLLGKKGDSYTGGIQPTWQTGTKVPKKKAPKVAPRGGGGRSY